MHERPGQQNKQRLTPKQEEVLALIARGHTNFEIAQRLGLSLDGVKYHVSEILGKLEVESREEAGAWWRAENGVSRKVGRLLRGLVGVPLVMRAATVVVAAGAAVGVVALAWVAVTSSETHKTDAEPILEKSVQAMTSASFTARVCEDCYSPMVVEFAPPNRLKVSTSYRGGGDFGYPFYHFDGERAYYSEEGERWTEGGSEAGLLANQLLIDPRLFLRATINPAIVGTETIEGRRTVLVTAGLDAHQYLSRLPPSLGIEADADTIDVIGGISYRLWVDEANYRVLRMEVVPPEDEAEQGPAIIFDYITKVDLPDKVKSLPADETRRLAFAAEKAGAQLLNGLIAYRTAYGVYPQALDSSVLPDWPTNPFTGQPVREGDGPGDFEYRTRDGDANIDFKLFGWDGISVYHDSAQFGHRDPGMGQRSSAPPGETAP